MADRIVVMNAGRIEQIGTPLELYDTPANLFVADFIGSPSMNFLPGTLEPGAVKLADGSRLPVAPVGQHDTGRQVIFGVRPEHLALSADGQGLAAEVEVVEPTGANIQVYAKVAGTPLCAVFTERHDFRPGQVIHLTAPVDKAHLFDQATGQRLDTILPGA